MTIAPAPSTHLSRGIIDPARCAQLIESCGTKAFGELLLNLASEVAAVEEIFAWERHDGCPQKTLVTASWLDDQHKRVEGYTGRFFRADPLTEQGGSPGFFMHVIGKEEVSFAEYRQICFDRPLFDHKISFVQRQPGHTIVLNFLFRKGATDLEHVLTSLTTLATVAIASLLRQGRAGKTDDALRRIEGKLQEKFPDLSHMERAVLARAALAMPPREIARSLAIKATSVKTYRSRALTKLGQVDIAPTLAQVVA
ncbi:LuxR C-terminal-related transcriptional regulator [Sphingomonas sp. IC081]|uniref:LuxR C-terminal-related transcriptional regulator n=1 Tax=Sphingomonas sp. IC081 TaxID=304378 RepID=UPI001156F755|nr:LuxR C-terminal-related transcriptional regulator [Sphingomonas sp. IC081]QDK35558.1 hypothetical protein DM450_22735 [Sphingomonas sp. IC081]